jgi:hypothetical protein
MADIYPTHRCFDDAIEFLEDIIKNKKELDESRLLVVHSICLMPDGQPYAHAWVEDPKTNSCIFKGTLKRKALYFQADRQEFYEQYKVQETTKYTVKQACLENLRTNSYGPWLPKYIALTKQNLTSSLQ